MSYDCGWHESFGTATCLNTVIGVKALGLPHVLKLWLA